MNAPDAPAEATGPRRIQLRRTKGWRKPAGAIVVARPSKWGNPFPVARNSGELFPRRDAVRMFRERLAAGEAWFGDHRFRPAYPALDDVRRELAGRDLACWCAETDWCHADVLLEFANADRAVTGGVQVMTTIDTPTIFATCAEQDRCVLCGCTDCAYWTAILAGRTPAVDGTEDCPSFYRGSVSLDRLAEVCEVPS